jgi:hypothetical protein
MKRYFIQKVLTFVGDELKTSNLVITQRGIIPQPDSQRDNLFVEDWQVTTPLENIPELIAELQKHLPVSE